MNAPAETLTREQLATRLQFTLVRPDATRDEIRRHVELSVANACSAAMIPMCWVPLARSIVQGTKVKVATCIGLSMGHESLHAKIALLRECKALGADEVDYEPNMAFFLSGMYDEFRAEGVALVAAAEGMPIKTMLELGYLKTLEQRQLAACLIDEAGVPWIKNSSGVGPGSEAASPENIKLLRDTVSPRCRVKASGKVASYAKVLSLLNAGAELIGTSNAIDILNGTEGGNTSY